MVRSLPSPPPSGIRTIARAVFSEEYEQSTGLVRGGIQRSTARFPSTRPRGWARLGSRTKEKNGWNSQIDATSEIHPSGRREVGGSEAQRSAQEEGVLRQEPLGARIGSSLLSFCQGASESCCSLQHLLHVPLLITGEIKRWTCFGATALTEHISTRNGQRLRHC